MQSVSKSKKAGLKFPVGRLKRYIKDRSKLRVSGTSAVYVAAVLEYMAAEVLELAGNVARKHQTKRITARHITLAMRDDEQLDKFVGKATVIAGGGVPPHIHPSLLPMKKSAKGEITRRIAHSQLDRQTQTLAAQES